MLKPWNGLRCMPLIAPSTNLRERSARLAIWARTSGSEYVRDGGMGGSLMLGDVGQQTLNDRVGRFPGGLGVIVGDNTVSQHRQRHRLDVIDRDAGSARQCRTSLGCEDQ